MIDLLGKNSLRFVFLCLLQVLILNNIHLFGLATPFLYVLFLLLLPVNIPHGILMVLGFLMGLTIDMFTNTPGMHAASCVFLTLLRPLIMRIMAPREGYEGDVTPSSGNYGLLWFFNYSLILVIAHHLFLFGIEVFSMAKVGYVFIHGLASAVLTQVLVLMSQLFVKKRVG